MTTQFECAKCDHKSTNPDHLAHAGTINVLTGEMTECGGAMMEIEVKGDVWRCADCHWVHWCPGNRIKDCVEHCLEHCDGKMIILGGCYSDGTGFEPWNEDNPPEFEPSWLDEWNSKVAT